MNMDFMKYAAAVQEIAGGFFDNENNYIPAIGKGNIVRVFCEFVSENKDVKTFDLNELGAFDYINKCMEMVGDEFSEALKDDDYFSFGSAVRDAEKMVELRKSQIIHENKINELLDIIIEKVKKIDENLNWDEINKLLERIESNTD